MVEVGLNRTHGSPETVGRELSSVGDPRERVFFVVAPHPRT